MLPFFAQDMPTPLFALRARPSSTPAARTINGPNKWENPLQIFTLYNGGGFYDGKIMNILELMFFFFLISKSKMWQTNGKDMEILLISKPGVSSTPRVYAGFMLWFC